MSWPWKIRPSPNKVYWSCKRKVRYANEADARRVRGRDRTLQVYACVFCAGFHLGHRKGSA